MSRWLDDFPTHSIVKSAAQLADRVGEPRARSKRAQGNEKVKDLRGGKKKKKKGKTQTKAEKCRARQEQ